MYLKIKGLADAAIALQNKDQMDAALREISALAEHEIARAATKERAEAMTCHKVVVSETDPDSWAIVVPRSESPKLNGNPEVQRQISGDHNPDLLVDVGAVENVTYGIASAMQSAADGENAKLRAQLDDTAVVKPAKKGGTK